jgi:hypothetical protein
MRDLPVSATIAALIVLVVVFGGLVWYIFGSSP